MCGIAGSVHFPLPLDAVMKSLSHRGPDEQRAWQDEQVQLINARLSIQELSEAGRQPMCLDELVIVFNGEIYNHFELRKKFDLTCHSHSDTETLLHLFRKLGIGMLRELDGMFAFCIYDTTTSKLWMARDRTGEKPFYYFHEGDAFVFASELNSLTPWVNAAVDDQKISNFISVGYLINDETSFKQVKQLSPGYFAEFTLSNSKLRIECWWSMYEAYSQAPFRGDFREALEHTDMLLEQSVRRRIHSSDKEVGTFLSGGIDSGLISAYASKQVNTLKTFTVSFDGLYNEGPIARRVAKHLGTVHEEIIIGMEELDSDIEKILRNYGEPITDDSIIPSYYVAREARKNLSVVLSGDGGDELFGGYRRYVPFSKIDFLSSKFKTQIKPLHNLLPFPRRKLHSYNYIYRFLGLLAKDWDEVYFAATIDLLHDYPSKFLIKPDYTAYANVIEPVVNKQWSGLRKVMYLDNTFLLQNILLKKMDIATMAHSLEARAPFLSYDMLEWAPTLPEGFKVNGIKTKFLLRELSKKYLPPEISNLPKRGFEIPLNDWVNTRLKKVIYDYLSPNSAYVKTLLSEAFVNDLLLKPGLFNPEKRAKALFALLSVEVWKKGLQK